MNKSKLEFIEPQSMNYEKKINSTFKEFMAKQNEQKQPEITNVKNRQMQGLTEDLLFETATASSIFKGIQSN